MQKKNKLMRILSAVVVISCGFFVFGPSAMDVATAANQFVAPNPPAGPLNIYGNVKIDGVPAPVGTQVDALLGGSKLASTAVSKVGEYNLNIIRGDLVFSTISLSVNGKEAASAVSVVNASSLKYDLSITSGSSGGGSSSGSTSGNNGANGNPNSGQNGNNSGQTNGGTSISVRDGDIIQCKSCANPSAVYIVKVANGKKFIRHIVSLQIFNHYKHLKWENLIQVNSLDGFSLAGWVRVNTGLNGTAGPKDKVYEINDDQTRHWIDMTAAEFLQHGGSDEAIYSVNQGELNLYKEGPAVKLQ
jgi:hypothetical protein